MPDAIRVRARLSVIRVASFHGSAELFGRFRGSFAGVTLVAGVDSSTQSCKVLVCDADTGEIVRSGTAPHPDGTEVNPQLWWAALETAIEGAGGLDDVAAASVGAQQHGMVCLDDVS